MPITISLALYCAAWFLLVRTLRQKQSRPAAIALSLIGAALLSHAFGAYMLTATPDGYDFSLQRIAPLFFWVANLLVLASCLRKPLHNLFLLLLPLTAVTLLLSLFAPQKGAHLVQLDDSTLAHIVLSIFAYSTLTIATLHALVLGYQNKQLHSKHATGFVRLLPPLQTMEALLFELLWAGQVLLTLSIVTGMLFVENFAGQQLGHKTIFSALAWLTYALLLWGHWLLGWRGNTAVRWTLTGFAFLVLAYFGSKFVLEVIIGS